MKLIHGTPESKLWFFDPSHPIPSPVLPSKYLVFVSIWFIFPNQYLFYNLQVYSFFASLPPLVVCYCPSIGWYWFPNFLASSPEKNQPGKILAHKSDHIRPLLKTLPCPWWLSIALGLKTPFHVWQHTAGHATHSSWLELSPSHHLIGSFCFRFHSTHPIFRDVPCDSMSFYPTPLYYSTQLTFFEAVTLVSSHESKFLEGRGPCLTRDKTSQYICTYYVAGPDLSTLQPFFIPHNSQEMMADSIVTNGARTQTSTELYFWEHWNNQLTNLSCN